MSRWGGFRAGRRLYTDTNIWDSFKTEATASAPTSPTEFDYSTAQGIWSLTSTNQFPKRTSAPSYELGLSSSLFSVSGQNAVWSLRTVDVSQYAGATVRVVFRYLNGSDYFGDIQLDQINIDGNLFGFEGTGENFQTSAGGESSYSVVSWQTLAIGTTVSKWNVDTGGTPSSSTGLTTAAVGSYYVYAETSAPANVSGYNFWLRSPQITLSNTPTLSFYEARSGSTIGTLYVHIDVIA